jgi:hypothetical protein
VIHRAAGYQSSIPKMESHAESSGYRKTKVEDSVAGPCDLMCIMSPSGVTLLLNKDGTRLMVKSIVVDVGMVATVRDLCMYERMSKILLSTASSTASSGTAS